MSTDLRYVLRYVIRRLIRYAKYAAIGGIAAVLGGTLLGTLGSGIAFFAAPSLGVGMGLGVLTAVTKVSKELSRAEHFGTGMEKEISRALQGVQEDTGYALQATLDHLTCWKNDARFRKPPADKTISTSRNVSSDHHSNPPSLPFLRLPPTLIFTLHALCALLTPPQFGWRHRGNHFRWGGALDDVKARAASGADGASDEATDAKKSDAASRRSDSNRQDVWMRA